MRCAAKHIIMILTALLASVGVRGQSYPVQANLYVLAPYSQTYSDYYADGQQRMYVSILLNDMTQGQLDVVLRFSIKGSNLRLTSNPVSPAKPITIQSGKLCRVEGTELAQFLKADCMLAEGRLADEFMKSGRLPEGHYDIKVEVVEFYRKARVSAPAYSTAWIVQPEPPVWTMPQKDAVLEATSPQYVLFGWMMTGNTTLLQNLRYTFSIYEKPTGVSADVAVKATAPIYSEELTQAMLIYGPDKPLLELGKTYACRVRVSDADNRASFKNDGYSEALAFRYGQECLPPAQPTVTDITGKGATLNWVSNQTQSGYDIEVRETTEGRGSDWYVWKLDRPAHDYTIRQLSPGSRYECRVAATCGQRGNGIRSPYSPTVTFATQAARSKVYECGGIAEDAAPTDLAPWPYLEEGEEITSAGFPFRILSISKNSGGIFSGQCAWQMPLWKISILCDFTDITVNFERQLLSGTITATHDRERAMAFSRIQRTAYEPIGTQVPVTFKAEKTVTAQQPVDSILVANGRTLIYMAGREPVRIDATDNVLVKSSDGNYYAVCGGKVYPKPSNMDGDGNVELSYTQQYAATFGRGATGPHHGLDNYTEEKKPFAAQYSRYLLHNSEACAAWMALPTGKTDFVLATVDGDRTYMHFRHNGQEMQTMPAPDNGQSVYLSVTEDGEYEAYYTTTDRKGRDVEVVAGRMNVAAYDETDISLCLVGVNGERYPGTIGELTGYLNEVYGQAVAKVSVTTANIEVGKFSGTLSAKESGALTAYNSDMKKLIRAVRKLPDYDKRTYYILLVNKSDNATLAGFMPVNSQFGFVFAEANTTSTQLNRTIAHELAHGAFRLWHTFSGSNLYTAPQGTTANLMDYNGTASELYKYQWDYIHNPRGGIVRWLVEDEGEGALMANMPNFFGQRVTTPNGSNQGIHEDAVPIQDENDNTIAFITPDEKVFLWVHEGQWEGYFENGEKSSTKIYSFYVEDKYMRESDPLSWGIYLAANDLGCFAIDMVESPGETTKNLATGIWKIATLQFDFEKTWERILSADRTDGAYVVSTLALGYLAGPKCKKLVTAKESPKFQEVLEQYVSKTRPTKLTWSQLLVLFKEAREFERLVSKHLKTIYKAEDGFSVTSQVYLKVDDVMSIADDIIYNSKTNQFILNETKYGVTNTLRKNQQVIENAIKAGKEIEIRSVGGIRDATNNVIATQGQKIKISKILRSHSVDGKITINTIKTTWP